LNAFLAQTRSTVDGVIRQWTALVRSEDPQVGPAIAYALESPGKRLRPALLVAAYRELGGRGPVEELAASVEVVHCYSLVHDDLPCMDDDDLRRGRPTTHRQFGVAQATEAGFRMIALAGRVLVAGARRLQVPRVVLQALARELFGAAGARGMIGGQALDLEAEGRRLSRSELERMHRAKTGALMAASVVMGGLAAGAEEPRIAALRAFGEDIGLAFQIADDLLDASASSDQLGKTPGKDRRQQKATFATVLGPAAARAEARSLAARAVDHLREARLDSTLLADLAHFMVERRS